MAQVLRTVSMTDADFKDRSKDDAKHFLDAELNKLLTTANAVERPQWEKEFDGFRALFARMLKESKMVDWSKIEMPKDDLIRPYDQLNQPSDAQIKAMLNKLVVVKLNGGLGTSMGCQGPKSLISVRNDLTFLDLNIQQILELNQKYEADVPLVLMNSFNTEEDTAKILHRYRRLGIRIEMFNQSRYPRINKESYAPVARSLTSPELEPWYPPGHGDFYNAFLNSGLLDKFIAEGKEYVFISNIDNLGSTVDLNILNMLLTDNTKHEYLMEVTDKTRADIKGGTLIEYEGKLRLLEIAQVPKDHVDEFKSVNKFRIFNTNNLWVNLPAMKRQLDAQAIEMEIIINPKHLKNGIDVIQLETAAGAAIKAFNNAVAVNVPRSRFLPVKKTQDLLLLMSDLYDLQAGSLTLSSKRQFQTTPIIKLGTSFDAVNNFLNRFAGVPHLLELDHLTVSGDVWFGKGVQLKGTVIIIANHGERIDIPPGALFENKIVSGNLRILDH